MLFLAGHSSCGPRGNLHCLIHNLLPGLPLDIGIQGWQMLAKLQGARLNLRAGPLIPDPRRNSSDMAEGLLLDLTAPTDTSQAIPAGDVSQTPMRKRSGLQKCLGLSWKRFCCPLFPKKITHPSHARVPSCCVSGNSHRRERGRLVSKSFSCLTSVGCDNPIIINSLWPWRSHLHIPYLPDYF